MKEPPKELICHKCGRPIDVEDGEQGEFIPAYYQGTAVGPPVPCILVHKFRCT